MTSSENIINDTDAQSSANQKAERYKSTPYPLWMRIIFFLPALITGAVIGSLAGIIVGFCILAEWLKDSYLRIFENEYWQNRPD